MPDNGGYVLRFRKGAKLKPTGRNLDFSKSAHPKAQAHWFDAAKNRYEKNWINVTKKAIGEK